MEWFPRLLHARPSERSNWRLIGRGHGVHWEEIDEDISVEGLVAGRPSGESQRSFKKWMDQRQSRLTKSRTYETLKRVQGDKSGLFTKPSSIARRIFYGFH